MLTEMQAPMSLYDCIVLETLLQLFGNFQCQHGGGLNVFFLELQTLTAAQ